MIGTYGHGTENDFVLIYDPADQITITADQIKRICNRATGIGADGIIRITKENNQWFMDYRNSDGSVAEMCGNGIRVMARYLVANGHQPAGIFRINTRAGMKFLQVPDEGEITVNMGQIQEVFGGISATANGHTWTGYNIEIGNPHAVVFVDDVQDAGDLTIAPQVEPADEYPDGVNVEFVQFLENGELKMRVHERGSGETRSCGTGTCAVALAATLKMKKQLPATWIINPPGGQLKVEIDAHSNAILTGPAVLIKDYELDLYL
ncbi:MAG: diaminopimelate epimerase [Actinomycetes bacterium]